jgi:hypothetical protein
MIMQTMITRDAAVDADLVTLVLGFTAACLGYRCTEPVRTVSDPLSKGFSAF